MTLMTPSKLERLYINEALPLCGAILYPAETAAQLTRTAETHGIRIKSIEAVHLENRKTQPRFKPSQDETHYHSVVDYIARYPEHVFEINY